MQQVDQAVVRQRSVCAFTLHPGLRAAQRGPACDRLQPANAVREPLLLGVMMLFGAASAAGLPPLPGFLGKLMVLEASAGLPAQAWVWSVVLVVGHSNTVPDLVAALCGCATDAMDETEYDRMSIVRFDADGRARLKVQRYGAPAGP